MIVLHLAGTYRREVMASLLRIHENVRDWEHLPSLHASSFSACELVDEDAEGWRIRLLAQPTRPGTALPDYVQTLKLAMAGDGLSYKVTTESGPGAASEIRVALTPRAEHHTSVEVQYHVPETDTDRLALIGAGFVQIYKTLWDEDEAMMHAREAALAPRTKVPAPDRLDLGPDTLPLPHIFDWGRHRFRLVNIDGTLIAHAATCPHWLAPLDDTPIEDGCITCPWHGYRFDVRSGQSADGRGLRLPPAPRISAEHGRIIACA